MSNSNAVRKLAFADDFIDAVLVENAENYPVDDAVVINLSTEPLRTGGDVDGILLPWRSTLLRGGSIAAGRRAAVVGVRQVVNLGGVGLRGWGWLGDRIRSFPRDTPLYISPQDTIGSVTCDPYVFTNERREHVEPQRFTVKLNLWWSPGNTDCFIHNEHPFLETHTQIHGVGRMQKFRDRSAQTMYEDVVLGPGASHDPFCRVAGPDVWQYPWHRYYADTDSVWLAVELHPDRAASS